MNNNIMCARKKKNKINTYSIEQWIILTGYNICLKWYCDIIYVLSNVFQTLFINSSIYYNGDIIIRIYDFFDSIRKQFSKRKKRRGKSSETTH